MSDKKTPITLSFTFEGQKHSLQVPIRIEKVRTYKLVFNKDFGSRNNSYTYHPKGEEVFTSIEPSKLSSIDFNDFRDGVPHKVPMSYVDREPHNDYDRYIIGDTYSAPNAFETAIKNSLKKS